MEYKVVKAIKTSTTELEELVQAEIKKGWKPLGGICAVKKDSGDMGLSFYQALIKE